MTGGQAKAGHLPRQGRTKDEKPEIGKIGFFFG